MPSHQDTVVVVPMYNEAAVITAVVTELRTAFMNVVCVDDGSEDDSAALAGSAGAVVLRHQQNLGQGAALQTGFDFALRAGAAFVITFDADGQHQIVDAQEMLRVARRSGSHVVLGTRFLTKGAQEIPRLRRNMLRLAAWFTRRTTGLNVTDAHNGLRVLNRQALSLIHITLNGMAHASEILDTVARLRLSYLEHPVTVMYTDYSRQKGQPSINAVNISFDLLGNRLRLGR